MFNNDGEELFIDSIICEKLSSSSYLKSFLLVLSLFSPIYDMYFVYVSREAGCEWLVQITKLFCKPDIVWTTQWKCNSISNKQMYCWIKKKFLFKEKCQHTVQRQRKMKKSHHQNTSNTIFIQSCWVIKPTKTRDSKYVNIFIERKSRIVEITFIPEVGS